MHKKIRDLVVKHFENRRFGPSPDITAQSALLTCFVVERDYEIKNRLLKKLVLKYAHAERKLTELNQLKNKFLGIAAHDLRNPLTSISGLSEILLEGAAGTLSEEQKELLTVIHAAAGGMLTLVNDLLDASVIESGRFELQLKWHSLDDIVRNRVRISKTLAEQKGVAFHEKYAGLPPVLIDPNRIAQVVDNLISNAIKFSSLGSKTYISTLHEEWAVRVSVRDEGVGILQEDLSRVFGEYTKLQARPTGDEKSTRLGLAIAKKIVEAHRGTLEVDSRPGVGSTFSFTIPREEPGV